MTYTVATLPALTTASEFEPLVKQLLENKKRTDKALAELKELAAGVSANQPTLAEATADFCHDLVIFTAVACYLAVIAFGLAATAAIRLGQIAGDYWRDHQLTERITAFVSEAGTDALMFATIKAEEFPAWAQGEWAATLGHHADMLTWCDRQSTKVTRVIRFCISQ